VHLVSVPHHDGVRVYDSENRDVDEEYRDEQLEEGEPRLVTRATRRARIGGCGVHVAHRTLLRGVNHHRASATRIERTRRPGPRNRRADGVPPSYFLLTSTSTLTMPEPLSVPKIFASACDIVPSYLTASNPGKDSVTCSVG